jgi:hypothetical protein
MFRILLFELTKVPNYLLCLQSTSLIWEALAFYNCLGRIGNYWNRTTRGLIIRLIHVYFYYVDVSVQYLGLIADYLRW